MTMKCFALEFGPKNIRVNAVNPTWIPTEMTRDYWSDSNKYKEVTSRIPMGRMAQVDEVADAVIFLLSDKSEMITGHSLLVDGGFTVI